jgi:hypothetical protein
MKDTLGQDGNTKEQFELVITYSINRYMLSFIEFLEEQGIICKPQKIPMSFEALQRVEDWINNIWKTLGVEVELGKETDHFFQRVNDPRNNEQISPCELQKLFLGTFMTYGKMISTKNPNYQAVLKDLSTDINIPFIIKIDRRTGNLELVTKTIMRKKSFNTPSQVLAIDKPNN